jgi:predicted  nucleic acid-binding Zn-ribbon protein
MQLRCTYCQTMFSIPQDEMLAGLEHMEEQKQSYYDAHCPKCRRANRVERARMERFFPDWKKAIKTMAKDSKQAEVVSEKPVEASLEEKSSSSVKKQPAGAKKK